MYQNSSFGFIGGGRITRLLLQALKQKNELPGKVVVADPDKHMRDRVKKIESTIIDCVTNNLDALEVDILFLAVHPPVMKDIAAQITGKLKAHTVVISLIPIIKIEQLISLLGGIKKIVRLIPNAPSIIHKGYNPVVYSRDINSSEKLQLQRLFSMWGESPEVDEQKLEAYAIVAAMGPTYFWFQWQKLFELGLQFGLTEAELKTSITAMTIGAAETLFESNLSPDEVLDLIPVCPLKEAEATIKDIFEQRLTALYRKLTRS